MHAFYFAIFTTPFDGTGLFVSQKAPFFPLSASAHIFISKARYDIGLYVTVTIKGRLIAYMTLPRNDTVLCHHLTAPEKDITPHLDKAFAGMWTRSAVLRQCLNIYIKGPVC